MLKGLKLLIIFFTFNYLYNQTRGFPYRWYDTKVITTNVPYLEPPNATKISEYIHIQDKILSKEKYTTNDELLARETDDKIIFPSDNMNIQQKYIPKPSHLCENLTYCENTLNYPNDFVEAALRMNKDLKFLPGVDLVPDVIHRIKASTEDYPLCDSKEMVIYPKAAKNQDKEWMFIVNQGNFIQSVRVEICGNEDSTCSLVDGFAEGYKTTCKQKYIYRQLMAVSLVGQIKPEIFRFPVSCCCHIKFIGDPLVRISTDIIKKSGLLSSRDQKI